MERSYKGFKRFVKRIAKRTPYRTMDHEDWCGCALGEYMKPARRTSNEALGKWALRHLPDEIYLSLGNAKNTGPLHTYKGLNNFLQRLG